MNNNNNKAFSLIELSIVLIIIGLLVAGITGEKSLIESAKIRNIINGFNNLEKSNNNNNNNNKAFSLIELSIILIIMNYWLPVLLAEGV